MTLLKARIQKFKKEKDANIRERILTSCLIKEIWLPGQQNFGCNNLQIWMCHFQSFMHQGFSQAGVTLQFVPRLSCNDY